MVSFCLSNFYHGDTETNCKLGPDVGLVRHFFTETIGSKANSKRLMIAFVYILAVFLLVFANGFFVASEFALVGVRRSRIQSCSVALRLLHGSRDTLPEKVMIGCGGFAVTLLMAFVSYHVYEKRFLLLKDRYWRVW